MTSETVPTPSESDVSAVEQRLAALYDELPASQQLVLDAILGAGLAVLSTASDDTSGYIDPALTNPAMLEAELRYRIGEIQKAARDIKVNREQIVFRFAGVRPLGSSPAKNTGQYSRDHSIEVLSGDWTHLGFPVYSLVGGKWTSFRAFAEEVTDKSLEFLGKKRQKHTRDLPIGGGRGYSSDPDEQKRQVDGLAAWTGLDRDQLGVLYKRYGSRAETIASFIKRAEDEPLKSIDEFTHREIAFLALHEKIQHLDDLLLRRTMLAMLGRLTRERVEELAHVLGESLGWSDTEKTAEVTRTFRLLEDRHGVRL